MKKMIIYSVLLLTSLSSCIKDNDINSSSCAETHVQLVIGNTASRAGVDASPDLIDRLRIYVFNEQNERVGYLFRDNLNAKDVISLPMPLDREASGKAVYFYVLANDLDGWALNENTSCSVLDEMSFKRWEEGDVPSLSPMVNNDNTSDKGGYKTRVQLTEEKWQNVNVHIQHIVGRLRLLLKKDGNGSIVINNATVYHRPDNYFLFDNANGNITFDKNSKDIKDQFIIEEPINSTTDYGVIGETYLAPNAYGTKDMTGDTYDPAYTDGGRDKAYILVIDYTVDNTSKRKIVFLPPVSRNQSIDVKGTLVSNSLKVHLTVKDWDVDDTEIDFSTEYTGALKPGDTPNSIMVDTDSDGKKAVAVATSRDGQERAATFSFKMTSPVGARWTAHLENTTDFRLEGTTFGVGDKDAVEAVFKVIPLKEHDATTPRSVNLFITQTSSFGGVDDEGILVINPPTEGVYKFPGDETKILIRQVGESAYDQLTESVTGE